MEHPTPRYSFLAFNLNRLIDEGRSIGVDEARDAIRDGSMFDRLADFHGDVGIYDAGERRTMLKVLEAVASEGSYGVKRNGLALYLACCVEVMQHGDVYGDERFDE